MQSFLTKISKFNVLLRHHDAFSYLLQKVNGLVVEIQHLMKITFCLLWGQRFSVVAGSVTNAYRKMKTDASTLL